MHGLINRSIEGFLRDTYGDSFWDDVAEAAGIDARGFQTIRDYPDAVSHGLVNHAALRLDKPEGELLEDLGAWLAGREPLRRLLRFSGRDFVDFIYSLEEWPGRAHMVIPDLGVPRIGIEASDDDGNLRVVLTGCFPEWRSVMAGLIRAMADDYGTLALISVEGNAVRVHISDQSFAAGRRFELAGPVFGGAS